MLYKILITGGSGFIGHHLAKQLSLDFEITIIDNLSDFYDLRLKIARNNQLGSEVKFVNLDLRNQKKIKNFFEKNHFDIVIHLAAQAGVRYSFTDPNSYIDNNILATFNLLESIKNKAIKHLIFSSTSSIYGYKKKGKFNETMKSDHQVSLYASTKKSCESLIYNYSYNYNIPSTILRFFTVYGPWGRPDMALFKFTHSILNNKIIDLYNGGNMWRDFTFIDDLVKSISLLINIPPSLISKNKIYADSNHAPYRMINVGNQKTVKISKIIQLLEEICKKKANINYLPIQPGDVPYTLSDCTLLQSLTNYSPNTPIKIGLKNFYNWYLDFYVNRKWK